MDETEDNDKAGPADIAASGGVHDLACTPTAAGKTQTADSIVDGMPEAARFLREKAAGALAMEEARAKTMAELRDIAHAALAAQAGSASSNPDPYVTKDETDEDNLPPLAHEGRIILPEEAEEGPQPQLGGSDQSESKRGAVANDEMGTGHSGPLSNTAPVPNTAGTRNSSVGSDTVLDGQSTTAGMDLPPLSKDASGGQTQAGWGADNGGTGKTRPVDIEKDVLRPIETPSHRRNLPEHKASPTEHRVAADFLAAVFLAVLGSEAPATHTATGIAGQHVAEGTLPINSAERRTVQTERSGNATPADGSVEAADNTAERGADTGSGYGRGISTAVGSLKTGSVDTPRTIASLETSMSIGSSAPSSSMPQASRSRITSLTAPAGVGAGVSYALGGAIQAPPTCESCAATGYLAQKYASLVVDEMAALADLAGSTDQAPAKGTIQSDKADLGRETPKQNISHPAREGGEGVDDNTDRSTGGGPLDTVSNVTSSGVGALEQVAGTSNKPQVLSTCSTSQTAPVETGAVGAFGVDENKQAFNICVSNCVAADYLAQEYMSLVAAEIATSSNIWSSTNPAPTGGMSQRTKPEPVGLQFERDISNRPERGGGAVGGNSDGSNGTGSCDTALTVALLDGSTPALSTAGNSTPQGSSDCATSRAVPVDPGADAGFTLDEASPTSVWSCVAIDYLAQAYASLVALEMAAPADVLGCMSEAPTGGTAPSENFEPVGVQSGKENPESPEKTDREVDDDVDRSIVGGYFDTGPTVESSEASASASSAAGSSILQVSPTCNTSLTAPVAAGAGVGYAVEENEKPSLVSIRRGVAVDCLAEVYAVLFVAQAAALADIGRSTNQAPTGRTIEREKVESPREQLDQDVLQPAGGSDGVIDADNGGNIIGESLNTGHSMTPSGIIALAPPAVCGSMPQASSTCSTWLTAPVAGAADIGFAPVKAAQDSSTCIESCVIADFLAQEYASLAASELAAQSDLVESTSQAPMGGAVLSEKVEPGRLKAELVISETAETCGTVVDNDNDGNNDGNNVGGHLDTGRTVASSDAGASVASTVGSRISQIPSTCKKPLKASMIAGARVEYEAGETAQASPSTLGSCVAADYLAQVYVSLAVPRASGGGASTLSLVAAAGRDCNASARTSLVDSRKAAGTVRNSVKPSTSLVASVTLQHRNDISGDESLPNDATRVASAAELRSPNDVCDVDDTLEGGFGTLVKADDEATRSIGDKIFTTDTTACPGNDLYSRGDIPAALGKEETADPALTFTGSTALMKVQDANFGRDRDEGGVNTDRSGGAQIDATRFSLIVVEAWKLINDVTLSSLAKATAALEAMARDQACKRVLLTPVCHLGDINLPPGIADLLRLDEPSQSSSTELWAARDNTQSTRIASPPEPVESPLQAAFVEDNVRQDMEGSENEAGYVKSEFTPCLPVSVETCTARQGSTTTAIGQTRDGNGMPDDVPRPSPVSAQASVPFASQDSKMTTQSAPELNELAGDATREQRPERDRRELGGIPSPPLQAAVVATYLSGAYGRALAAAGAQTSCAGIRKMSPDTLSVGDEVVCISDTDAIGNQRDLVSLLLRDGPKVCVAAWTLESPENETCTSRMPLEHQTIKNLANSQVVEADNVTGSSMARPCELLISPGVKEEQVLTPPFRRASPAASSTETITVGSVLESTVEKTEPAPCANKGEQCLSEELRGLSAQVQREDVEKKAPENGGDVSPTFPPTPPATPDEESYGVVNLKITPDFQSIPGDGRPPPPKEEALRWLQAVGVRAKSMQHHVARSPPATAEGLHETGERGKSSPDGATTRRVNAVAWLQEAGIRAKSQQSRADDAMLELRRNRGEPRIEAAEWLQTVGARAKSRQDNAVGIRSKAAAWLNTRGATELQQLQLLERSTAVSCGKLDGDVFGQHVSSESIRESNTESPTKIEDVIDSDECYLPNEDKFAAQRKGNGRSTVLLAEVEANGSAKSVKGSITPPVAEVQINARETSPTAPKRSSQTASVLALGIANVGRPADRPPSADRTAPAPWLEPVQAQLPRGGSVAPTEPAEEDLSRMLNVGEMESTEEGPGGMLEVGEKEWARVSLSRTPPFDALNSPSPAVRWPPAGGRLRAFPPGVDGLDSSTMPSTIAIKAGDVGGLTQTGTVAAPGGGGASGCGMMPAANAGGAGWVEFFAPAHRMAPTGDAYGIDSFRSSGASASTTVRGDSTGSFMPPDARYVADEEQPTRRHNKQEWRWSNAAESRTLCEVQNPVADAQRRIRDRQQHLRYKQGGRGSSEEETDQSVTSSGRVRGMSSRRRWNKVAERSRQYTRDWETFLSQAHLYFNGEAELRKRLSVIRRAHPTVSNEVAFIALAQSRGRASEAAAVLHLARAKDEASLIAMMLDVTSFIAFAREAAERRRRLRQLEGERETHNNPVQSKPSPSCPDLQQREETRQPQVLRCQLKSSEQHGQEGPFVLGEAGTPSRGDDGIASGGVGCGWGEGRHAPNRTRPGYRAERLATSQDGEGQCELQSRRLGSAPALLPPLVGLTVGTPPTPKTLKTVLSTSTSMAVAIPQEFGLMPEIGEDAKRMAVTGRNASDTREHKASRRARARRQRKKMAEMSALGGCSENSGTSLDALTDRFINETCTLARDSRHVDARVRRRQRGLAGRGGAGKGAGGNGSNNSRVTGSASLSWGQGSPVFLESIPDVTAESQGQGREEEGLSNRAPPAISPELGGDRRSCRVQSYFAQATRCSLEAVGLREERQGKSAQPRERTINNY